MPDVGADVVKASSRTPIFAVYQRDGETRSST